jgi:hypothetical protein
LDLLGANADSEIGAAVESTSESRVQRWGTKKEGLPLFCLLVDAEVDLLDGFFSFLLDELDGCGSPLAFLSRPLLY